MTSSSAPLRSAIPTVLLCLTLAATADAAESVVGWGLDDHGQATPPNAVNGISGTATDIAEGIAHSLAADAAAQPTATATPTAIPTVTPTATPTYDTECKDGVSDPLDNCLDACNPAQDDTDSDDCGNYCDADYDNDGIVGFLDFGQFVAAFGTNDEEKCHFEPTPGCTVGFPDFGFLVSAFGSAPGPSGTTAGTTACPAMPTPTAIPTPTP